MNEFDKTCYVQVVFLMSVLPAKKLFQYCEHTEISKGLVKTSIAGEKTFSESVLWSVLHVDEL